MWRLAKVPRLLFDLTSMFREFAPHLLHTRVRMAAVRLHASFPKRSSNAPSREYHPDIWLLLLEFLCSLTNSSFTAFLCSLRILAAIQNCNSDGCAKRRIKHAVCPLPAQRRVAKVGHAVGHSLVLGGNMSPIGHRRSSRALSAVSSTNSELGQPRLALIR